MRSPRFDHGVGAALANTELHLTRLKEKSEEVQRLLEDAQARIQDHHINDRTRHARTLEQTREHINTDHPCCIPIGDAVWMLHAYDELLTEVKRLRARSDAERRWVDLLDNTVTLLERDVRAMKEAIK